MRENSRSRANQLRSDAGENQKEVFLTSITYTVETSTDLRDSVTEGVSLSEPDPDGNRAASVRVVATRCFLPLVVAE